MYVSYICMNYVQIVILSHFIVTYTYIYPAPMWRLR